MPGEIAKRDLSKSNELLLKHARLSPKEISEKTGFDPVDAMQRIAELLETRDWRSMRQDEQLLIMDLQGMVDVLKERMNNASDEDFAAIATVSVRAMKEVGVRLDAQRKLIDADITRIDSAHARMYGASFDAALDHILDGLQENHPEISRTELRQLTREGMTKAKQKLEEFTDDR